MPNQRHLECPGESRCAVFPSKHRLFIFSFIFIFGVVGNAIAAPVITSLTQAGGMVGTTFSYQIMATDTPTGYRAWGLPPGLAVNGTTGLISGIPTAAATSNVILIAVNGDQAGFAQLTIVIAGGGAGVAPAITSATAGGTVGSAFSYQIAAANAPTSYSATGLPAGLTVNNTTGLISGTPTGPGTATVALSATNSSGTGQGALTLTFTATSGTGAGISPASVAFGNEPADTTSSSQTVTLSNTGSAALSISGITFAGANAADFSEANTCGSSVAAGGNCTIALLFTPSAIGSHAATLTVTDNATGSPQTVTLSGTGTHDVIVAWSPSPTLGIAGYNVFRGTTSGGESTTPLNSSPISGTTFTDQNVQPGQTYYYLVTTVASNDATQSADSVEASATVPSP